MTLKGAQNPRNAAMYKPCPGCGKLMAKHAYRCRACSPLIRGENHYAWKGDAARNETKRERAQKLYSLGSCERCGTEATDRHHKDGDPGNNVPENIAILCRRCHMEVDGRLARLREMATAARPLAAHGTRARYDRGCHCADCRSAYARYRRERRAAKRAS